MRFGLGMSTDDCLLVLRGLPSIEVRYHLHVRSALSISSWLRSCLAISAVLHPAFDNCSGYIYWKRDFLGVGELFSGI
ncbi:PLP-dependent transferase [Candidatus Vallotiella sp. (ex Adelges kitamiensis)]|uniref:PLP-dependent transferase n=1 Tax=Candidatus Vallotiella sp. (ex Adelges kitamiensis) TaxID=2864217 RepID=UPI001EF051E6|nr:PLP-dependent transferase [Candidatus Vallotia sp. (ex Adelges kitamiensis)]